MKSDNIFKSVMTTALCLCIFALASTVSASTSRYRIVWQSNPESEATVIWDQLSGTNPQVYYSTLDHGQTIGNYENSKAPDSTLAFRGMTNTFAVLSGLQPDTIYYFVIADSEGVSDRMYFRTAAVTKQPFKFIQGGDSRNNRGVRQDGNMLVAKLRPLFVSFGGDLIATGSDTEWQNWFDDWQLTIASDGRVTPIVPIRGNHEDATEIPSLFGLDNASAYYKISVNGGLFCQYLLNSEINTSGAQKTWLETDLQATYSNYTFISASYHKPMRPHVSTKSEGDHVYNAWAQLFYDYRLDILAENDSHCVKRTIALKPSIGSGNEQGFIAAADGYIKIGEGTWGAPLRAADDSKGWTLDSGAFNCFDLLHVYTDKIEVRTVKFANQSSVPELTILDDVFALPANLDLWQANGGEVQTVYPKTRIGPPVPHPVFSFGSEWRYYDNVVAPDPTWKDSSFDDSSWPLGNGQFGFGDGDETTVLDYGGDPGNKTAAYYFRKEINLGSVNSETVLTIDVTYDDGFVVYVNGQEVSRINMPTGTITHTTFAASTSSDNSNASVVVPDTFWRVGSNVICIELHNRSLTSSDVSFDAKISANQNVLAKPISDISLPAGISLIGYTGAEPIDTTLAFQGLIDADQLALVRWVDPSNGLIKELYYTTFPSPIWVNEIGDLTLGQGYVVRTTQACVLSIDGFKSTAAVTHNLPSGYSIVGYNKEDPMDAQAAFQSLIDLNKLELIRWVDPASGQIKELYYTVFPSPGWVNEIGDLTEGQGYIIKVNSAHNGFSLP